MEATSKDLGSIQEYEIAFDDTSSHNLEVILSPKPLTKSAGKFFYLAIVIVGGGHDLSYPVGESDDRGPDACVSHDSPW